MSNLTLSIDDEILKRARIRAIEDGTSVNAVVRDHLRQYAGGSDVPRALGEVLAIADRASGSSGPGGRAWTRADLYDERLTGGES